MSLLFWVILAAVPVVLLVFYIIIHFDTIKRNRHTLAYYVTPSLLFLALVFATRDYSNWSRFGLSFLNPLSIILSVLAVWRLFKLVLVLNCIRLYGRFINFIDDNKYVIVVDGFFGAGKSSTTSEYCVILADIMWDRIKYDYWLLRNTKKRAKNNKKHELDLEDNKTAHEYWTANGEYFPCLFSNIDHYDMTNKTDSGMTVDGLRVKYATRNMLNKCEPIPYGSVIHLEELGDIAGNKLSDKEGKELLDGVSQVIGRYPRHYGLHFVINDQDCNNLFINIRRGVALNQLMIKQVWACRPKLLLFIQSILKWFVIKFNYRDCNLLAAFMLWLNKCIKRIGFRKYWSELRGNTQNGVTESEGKFVFCIPSVLLARFDDRYKRTSYFAPPSEPQART